MPEWIIAVIIGGLLLALAGVKIYLKLRKAPGELSELKKLNLEPEKNIGLIAPEPDIIEPELSEEEKEVKKGEEKKKPGKNRASI